jgi:hypothetical protein
VERLLTDPRHVAQLPLLLEAADGVAVIDDPLGEDGTSIGRVYWLSTRPLVAAEDRDELRRLRLADLRQKVATGLESLDRGEGLDGETVFDELHAGLGAEDDRG